jgi:hypothetical protein
VTSGTASKRQGRPQPRHLAPGGWRHDNRRGKPQKKNQKETSKLAKVWKAALKHNWKYKG